MQHLTATQLVSGLSRIRLSPRAVGSVELIVARPAPGERRVVDQGMLDPVMGLVGDNWHQGATDGFVDNQLTLMNSRAVDLMAQTRDRWPLAGDQIYVDLDLSIANLPAGQRVRLGAAVIEVSALPHTGCGKFASRFGAEALKFVNSEEGKPLRLRGLNAHIVSGGAVAKGDKVEKV